MRTETVFALVFGIALALMLALHVIGIYGDWLWFLSLGYEAVFWTILSTKVLLALTTGLLFFALLAVNLRLMRLKKKKDGFFYYIIAFIALPVGFAFSTGWEAVLKYFNKVGFGILDPVFAQDLGFYVFELPFYQLILAFLLVSFSLSALFVFLRHLYHSEYFKIETEGEGINWKREKTKFLKGRTYSHITILVGILLLVVAAWLWLERFNILFSPRGAVFGAAYTDLMVQLPLLTALAIASAAVGLAFFLNVKLRNFKLPFFGVGALVGILVLGSLAAFVVQEFTVRPDELNLEKEYIQRNINFTLQAYDLADLEEKPFPVSYTLSTEDLEMNKGTVDNIRLWDWRPLLRTYYQLQLFRTYYDFVDVDIDRYYFDGQYKQVMLSPRELNQDKLPPKAQTWVNQRLVYTHGYGLAMSPVSELSEEGLPELYVKDIPPRSDKLTINRSEIYYGEQTNQFVVVRTTTEEFDYPKEEENVYTTYQGEGGVELGSFRRLAYAIKFGSIEILISRSIQPESKILFYRNIHERVRMIAPFLRYDADPYMVTAGGKLYWIYDAYTVTDRYPYSEPASPGLNYVRNSVKVVIDAYNGDVDYYVIDEDPIIQTYEKMFPTLFKNFSSMPTELQAHIRYPEDLFKIQAAIYSTYHMKDPRVFYNKEDVWTTPYEIYRGVKQKVIPYYILMKLPGQEKEEFILMIPFTPREKDNMIGWMAAKSDWPGYGEKVVYLFPKGELIYGPLQIEARIDQDPKISEKVTLWGQVGSEIIRGNLIVIPIESSILYVEALYLQAAETGAIPQLKRVIVAYDDKLTMQPDLETALNVIFGEAVPVEVPVTEEIKKTVQDLIDEAQEHYTAAQNAMKVGDWATYGTEIEQLGEILEELEKAGG